ncbi:MAG: hypothetical protein AB7I09_01430 [Planctomycetota bacterium]
MSRSWVSFSLFWWVVAVAGMGSATAQTTADFRVVDDIRGEWVNLNHAPVRPMAFASGSQDLWAVNTHDSTVVKFSGLTPSPQKRYRVPWSPVSIALWTDPNARTRPDRLIVVCRGTYGLAVLEEQTGALVGFIPLPAEPGDVLIVGDDAWVSCSGADQVVRVDLVNQAIHLTVPIPSEHPLFLTADGDGVLVTPLLSGNNTVVDKTNQPRDRTADRRGLLDLTDPNIATIPLPDQDVFRIDANGTVTQTVSGVGTILFGHAINPVTGELWVLNTEANNLGKLDTNYPPMTTDPKLLQSEPSIRGMNVRNRITRVDLATGAKSIIELELDGAGAYADARTIGQPYAIDFVPLGELGQGSAYIVGLLTNRVVVYDALGQFVQVYDILPAGSIPRGVKFDATNNRLYVYCWGTNEIQVFTLGSPVTTDVVMDLGFDPAPADVQEGRKLFYDGSHSRHGDESCATCHIDGRLDLIAWDLSNRPFDDKGPLTTQNLSGIERMRPFHWRGEQRNGLIDFNAAFDALLGGSPLDTTNGDFAKFEKFVFSIQAPANPFLDPERVVNNAFAPPLPSVLPAGFSGVTSADVVNGQNLWFDLATVGNLSCNDCHTLPIGTNADIIADGSDLHPKRGRLMVTGFNETWRKVQDTALVTLHEVDDMGVMTGNLTTRRFPLAGHGFAHSGAAASLLEFTRGAGGITAQQVWDIAAFVTTLDTGIAPAAHAGLLLNQANPGAANEITARLLKQAQLGNCDVVAFGTSTFSQPTEVRWVYDPVADVFASEFAPLTRPFSFFESQAQAGQGANVFVGLPLGMGRRFAIDFDADGLPNISESRSWGSLPLVKDSDGDTFEDGHEVDNGSHPNNPTSTPTDVTAPTVASLTVDWVNTKNVKLGFRTSEPCTYEIDLVSPAHTVPTVIGAQRSTVHDVVINGLRPSTTGAVVQYSGTLRVEDRGGNVTTVPLPSIDTLAINPGNGNAVVVSDLRWVQPILYQVGSTAVSAQAEAVVRRRNLPDSAVVQDIVLVARVLIQRAGEDLADVSTTFTSPLRFDAFTHAAGAGQIPPTEFLPGPYLMSTASNAAGVALFDLGQAGLMPGDRVILSIEGASATPAGYPTPPLAFPDNLARWSLPETPAEFRSITITMP